MARIGVGAGEAGFSPSAYSLLSDYFPRERLASAMGVYQMGVYLGGALALLIGGLVAGVLPPESSFTLPVIGAVKGWHVVFLALGVPGLLLSLLVLAIREPARRGLTSDSGSVPLATLFSHVVPYTEKTSSGLVNRDVNGARAADFPPQWYVQPNLPTRMNNLFPDTPAKAAADKAGRPYIPDRTTKR